MLEMMTSSILKKISEPGLEIDPEVFQKLVASDGAANDRFGYSVSISGDGTTTQKLIASDGALNNYFGYSVDVSQTSVVIGAYRHLGKGAVYVY